MNFFIVFFKLLYNKNSIELGILYVEKIKLRRLQVFEDVENSYDVCKEFVILVINGYMIVVFLKYFDVEGLELFLLVVFKELNKFMILCEENFFFI